MCEFLHVGNVFNREILLLVGYGLTARVFFVVWRVIGSGGKMILTNSEKLILGGGALSSGQRSYLCFLKFVFRYLPQYPEEHQLFFRFIWSRDLSRNCRATEQRQKMMTSGRFKVMFKNERYNKSFCYSELILTDNENQKSFVSVL